MRRLSSLALALALALAVGCSAEAPPPCTQPFISGTNMARVGEVLDFGVYAADVYDCTVPELQWVVDGPDGVIEVDGPSGRGSAARFHADQPGTYRVHVEPEASAASAEDRAPYEVTVFVYEATLPFDREVVEVAGHCNDEELVGGVYLCVADGVAAIDPHSGEVLGRTQEKVPAAYGLAGGDGFFATAAFGTQLGGAFGDEGEPGGLRLYDLVDRRPVLRSSVAMPGEAEEVAVQGDLVAVSLHGKGLRLLDAHDRQHPRVVGCFEQDGYGAPLFGEQGVWLIDGALSWFPFAELHEDCAASAPPVRLEDVTYDAPGKVPGALLHDGRIYLTYRSGIQVLDVRDPLQPTRGVHVPIPVRDAVIVGGRLYAIDRWGTRILVFELIDGTPVLVGDGARGERHWRRLATDGEALFVQR